MPKKVIVVAAVNGGMQRSKDGARVPLTPSEIAEEALECYNEGASILHFHARDKDGANSSDLDIYSEVITRIRKKCDILIQTTNGIGVKKHPTTGETIWPSDDERLGLLRLNPGPDLFGIAAGSTDFFHPDGGYPEETPYINSRRFLETTIPHVFAKGTTVEFELTDINVTNRLSRIADAGVFDRNQSNLWMLHAGGVGNKPATARNMVYSTDEMYRHFPNAKWGVLGGGVHNFSYTAIGLGMGCDSVRVGFEDSLYMPDGSIGTTNAKQVRAIVDLARAVGREPTSVAETREIFELPAQ